MEQFKIPVKGYYHLDSITIGEVAEALKHHTNSEQVPTVIFLSPLDARELASSCNSHKIAYHWKGQLLYVEIKVSLTQENNTCFIF